MTRSTALVSVMTLITFINDKHSQNQKAQPSQCVIMTGSTYLMTFINAKISLDATTIAQAVQTTAKKYLI